MTSSCLPFAWLVQGAFVALLLDTSRAVALEPAVHPGGRAPEVVAAEEYAAEAYEAYRRGAHAEAIVLYEQAYAARPSAVILYNIARVHDVGLGDRERAIDYYERYAASPTANPSRRERSLRRAAELRAAEEATAPSSSSPPAAARLETPAPTTGGSSEALRRDALPGEAPTADAGTSWSARDVTALAFWGSGLASVALGVGFGISAHAENDTWQRYCEGNECSSERGVDAARSARHKANVATVGLSLGGALLAAGTVLWLLDDAEAPAAAESARFELEFGARSAALGATLSGAF